MNSVSKSLLSGIAFASTALSVWTDLKERELLLFPSIIPDSKVYGMSLRHWYLLLVATVARSQILMMDPLPSINHAYA
ncbi:hypothetical protein KY284_020412 [Solanum tuberosum]|nr:hypothetical protein KY284_020412 [Solanum tuberosum]